MELHVIDCWINLASEIVRSGINAKDEEFLNSEWCEYLMDLVMEWTRLRTISPVPQCKGGIL